jgi:hypothetical protein
MVLVLFWVFLLPLVPEPNCLKIMATDIGHRHVLFGQSTQYSIHFIQFISSGMAVPVMSLTVLEVAD